MTAKRMIKMIKQRNLKLGRGDISLDQKGQILYDLLKINNLQQHLSETDRKKLAQEQRDWIDSNQETL